MSEDLPTEGFQFEPQSNSWFGLSYLLPAFHTGGNCGSKSFRFSVIGLENDLVRVEYSRSNIRSCSSPLCNTPCAPCNFPRPHPTGIVSYCNPVLVLVISRNLDVLKIKNFIHFFWRGWGDGDQFRLIREESWCWLVEILSSKKL